MKSGLLMIILVIVLAAPLCSVSYAQKSTYSGSVDGQSFTIPYEAASGEITDVKADYKSSTLTISFAPSQDTNLTMQFPRQILDKIGNIGMLTAFIDSEQSVVQELSQTCDVRTISIPNIPKGAGEIQLVGEPNNLQTANSPRAELFVTADNRSFDINISSSSTVCSLEFSPDQKTIKVSVQNGTYMRIAFPKELLGGPYSVILDGQPATINETESSVGTSAVFVKYSNAKQIEIIGTTAIPEFSSSVIIAASAASSLGILFVRIHSTRQSTIGP